MEIMDMSIEQAIIVQACEDYRGALRHRNAKRYPRSILEEVPRFFNSKWGRELAAICKVDGRYLLDKLNKEWEEGKILIEAGNQIECHEYKKTYDFQCPLCSGRATVIAFRTRKGSCKTYYCTKCKTQETMILCESQGSR